MKKFFHVAVALVALLSSFTFSASAAFDSSDSQTLTNIYKQLTDIRDELGYPQGGFSSLRAVVNSINSYLASIASGSSRDYSTVLSNIKSNSDSLVSYIKLIEGDTNNISARSTDLLNKLNDVYLRQGQMQLAITNHIDSASSQNHSDLDSLYNRFVTMFGSSALGDTDAYKYYCDLFDPTTSSYSSSSSLDWGHFLPVVAYSLAFDSGDNVLVPSYEPSLYHRIKQLQLVLASDDDLQLKEDNKANEDAATDAFVNGSSSKTSLGAGDIGNLKDVGGSFNDLTSLNGQSSITSFLNGLSSADGTGQGWFSEATRASLDAVSPVPTNKVRAFDVYRGERSSTYVILPDVSLVSPGMYSEPVDVAVSVSSDDPYNMSGFEDNYNWLWGDAS